MILASTARHKFQGETAIKILLLKIKELDPKLQ